MLSQSRFIYKIRLTSMQDVFEFVRCAVRCEYDIALVNGKHRLNPKSYLGVFLAKTSWDEIYLECDDDCYFDFEKFID